MMVRHRDKQTADGHGNDEQADYLPGARRTCEAGDPRSHKAGSDQCRQSAEAESQHGERAVDGITGGERPDQHEVDQAAG